MNKDITTWNWSWIRILEGRSTIEVKHNCKDFDGFYECEFNNKKYTYLFKEEKLNKR